MPQTFEAIGTVTLGTSTSTTTFSSIPATYTDLRLVCNIKGPSTSERYPTITFNSLASSSIWSSTALTGNGTSTQTGNISDNAYGGGPTYPGAVLSNTYTATVTFDISAYTSTTKFKSYAAELASDANGTGWCGIGVGLCRSTDAITSLTLYWTGVGGTAAAGSTATLYGILGA